MAKKEHLAVLLNKLNPKYLKELHKLLSPPDALGKNYELLAGSLNFSLNDINYMRTKDYPFIYMLNQWILNEKDKATLEVMWRELVNMERCDAAKVVEDAIKALKKMDPEQRDRRSFAGKLLRRFASNTTLFRSESLNSLDKEQPLTISVQAKSLDCPQKKMQLNSKKVLSPRVFVVYYPDTQEHVKNIARFVRNMRKKFKIDVSVDLFEKSECADDRALYYYKRITEAEYIFMVCSPALHACITKINTNQLDSEKVNELSFISKIILDDIFSNGGINSKFIPVLVTNLCNEEHIPSILKSATPYKIPHEYQKLVSRVLKIEPHRFCTVAEKRPMFIPSKLDDSAGLLLFTLT